ncbi:MAG: hypothetical protein NVSMB27_09170 [Ktedonobacteraceae bacterium]
MGCKKVCLIINSRNGQNMAKITDLLAVLSAAGWKNDILLKKYCGETMELASEAAKKDYHLIVAYGGDGTLNQVLNGVMNARGQSIVGLITGGTTNEWAGEVHIPLDPVKAALALINSEARRVDLGHVAVQSLFFPQNNLHCKTPHTHGKEVAKKKKKGSSKAPHQFLLMAGLGIDATVIGQTSNTLKHHIGRVAFDLTAAKAIFTHQPFPVEIRNGNRSEGDILWQGNAIQVIVANTRRYANMVEIAPDAYLDDGDFDVCIITGGDPLTMIGQITSIVLRHKPDDMNTHYFQGAHFSIRVPASIQLQLDGSTVRLKDYLSKAEREALSREDARQVMVDYRFDALPKAIQMAIPRAYDEAMFEKKHHEDRDETGELHQTSSVVEVAEDERLQALEHIEALLVNGRKVTVVAGVPNQHRYIIAGRTARQSTGEMRPVAIRIDDKTTVMNQAGEHLSPIMLEKLQEGQAIVVEGKKSKRGVIRATHVVV